MIRKPVLLSVLIASAYFLVPSQGHADRTDDARVLYLKGNSAFQKGDTILARDYYRKSLELRDSFDTWCNLGRAQAMDTLYQDAYRSLTWCVELYPKDAELVDAREKFVEIRTEMRGRVSSADASSIDAEVAMEVQRRRDAVKNEVAPEPAATVAPDSAAPPAPAPTTQKVKWKLPLTLSLAGVGAATGVVGGVMLARSSSLKEDANDLSEGLGSDSCFDAASDPACSELADTVQKSDNAKIVGTSALIGGGVLLASSLLLHLLVPSERSVARSEQRSLVLGLRLDAVVEPRSGDFRVGLSGSF